MNLKFAWLINHRGASTGRRTLLENIYGYQYGAVHSLCARSTSEGGDMAAEEIGLSKEYGGDSYGHPVDGNINSGGCTRKRETRSRIGPDAVTSLGGWPMNYNRKAKGSTGRDHG